MSGNTKTPPFPGGVDRYFVNGIIHPIFIRAGVLLGGATLVNGYDFSFPIFGFDNQRVGFLHLPFGVIT